MVEVKVNSRQWNAADAATQDQIVSMLKSEMRLPDDITIAPSDDVPEVIQNDRQVWGFPGDFIDPILPPGPIKDAICDAAAAAGMAGCAKFSGPGYVACVAGVEALRRDCKG